MGQTANMLGFVDCVVSVATIHFYHHYLEATIHNILKKVTIEGGGLLPVIGCPLC